MIPPTFLSLCVFLSFASQALTLDLLPLPSEHFIDNPRNLKRGTDRSRLDLQNYESFYWGGHGGDSLIFANLTVYFKDEFEFIIGMERFDGMLKSIDCSNNMMLQFKDNATFSYAKAQWNWVSDDVNNTFVIVANHDGCGPDQERQPYLVNDITFEPQTFKVFLKAQQKEWEDVANTYSFNMGYRPPLNTSIITKRDDPDFTMSLASNFNKNLFSTTVSGVDLSVDCVDCGTSGRILVDFDLDVGWTDTKLAMKVSPQDVAATLQLALSAKGTLSKEYRWEKTLISIPIEGVKVGSFAKIGAFLDVDVGFTVEEWTGEVEATFGAKMGLSNSAIVEINALDPGKGKFSGWSPALTPIPFTLSAKIEGGIEIYAQPSIALSAIAFKKGLEMSLDLKMPYIEADFTAMAISSGVCNTQQTLGVDVDASAGVDLSVQVATAGNEANPLWEQSLFEKSWPLFSKCFPFGPKNAHKGATPQPQPPKKSKTKAPKPKTKMPPKPKPTQEAPAKTLKPTKQTKPSATNTEASDNDPKKTAKPSAIKNTKTSDDNSKSTTESGTSKENEKGTSSSKRSSQSTTETTSISKAASLSKSSHSPSLSHSSASKSSSSVTPSSSTVSSSSSSTAASCSLQTGSSRSKRAPCGDFTCAEIQKDVETELTGLTIEARDSNLIGSMSAMKSRTELSKRTAKTGKACKIQWNADEYPEGTWRKTDEQGTFDMAKQGYYGWVNPDVCTSMEWGNPLTNAQVATHATTDVKYQVEHVMEWQLVTNFFDWIDAKGGKYPDPSGGHQDVSFCKYFAGTFDNTKTFTLADGTATLTAKGHMAAAFPSKQNNYREFVWLQEKMNSPAKSNVYSSHTKDTVYGPDKMLKQLTTEKGATQAMIKLKILMGVRKYMKDPKIASYFRLQKERMGATLELLDTAMVDQPKVVNGKNYTAWKAQDLKTLWDTYMNERFALGVKRVSKDMDNYLPKLNAQYGKSTDHILAQGIKNLVSEWKHERASKWEVPWASTRTVLGGTGA